MLSAAAREEQLAVERAETEESERAAREAWQAEIAALEAKRIAETARIDAARLALWQQDPDFHALQITLAFEIEGAGDASSPLNGEYGPAEWELDEDEAVNADLVAEVTPQVIEAIAPWVSRYHGMGLIRGDSLRSHLLADLGGDGEEPVFYLVCDAGHDADAPATLATFPEVRLSLNALPDATLLLSARARPINATRLFEAAQQIDMRVGPWGGEATPELSPAQGESRADWLGRVCMPATTLDRELERWRRSGGELVLYGLFGSASERAAGDQPIEWIVPGLIPRGEVTLLVGTKMAGKSTLLGEMMAVFDSECQSRRSVLGIEMTARGIGGIVSGEDGDNIINSRAKFYEPVHGLARGFVIDVARHPWPETLELLRALPRLDFLGIDPLRVILGGDEDASINSSRIYDDLINLARSKSCAIVLVHHLSKKVPRSLSAMLGAVRGSSAISDRPRMAIGMLNRGAGITEVGIIKHNIPPSEALWGELNVGRLFRRDDATLTLVPIEAQGIPSGKDACGSSQINLILEAIRYQNRLSLVLRRTGKSELYERRVPQLAGLSRNVIREGVATLMEAGLLTDGQDGLRVVDETLPDPIAEPIAADAATPATHPGGK
jgi:hypothetical protein